MTTLSAIASYFDVPADFLLGRNDVLVSEDDAAKAGARSTVAANDPRVAEIAARLKSMNLPDKALDMITDFARFVAEQEKLHPKKD